MSGMITRLNISTISLYLGGRAFRLVTPWCLVYHQIPHFTVTRDLSWCPVVPHTRMKECLHFFPECWLPQSYVFTFSLFTAKEADLHGGTPKITRNSVSQSRLRLDSIEDDGSNCNLSCDLISPVEKIGNMRCQPLLPFCCLLRVPCGWSCLHGFPKKSYRASCDSSQEGSHQQKSLAFSML